MHSQTLLIIASILMGLVTTVLAAMGYFNRPIPGLRGWAMSYLCGFLYCLILLVHGALSEPWFVIGSQALIFLTAYLGFVAARTYVGRPRLPHRYAVCVLAALGILVLRFTVETPNPGLRFAVSSMMTGTLFLLSARTLATGGMGRFPSRYLFALTSGGHGIFLLLRPVLFKLGEGGVFDATHSLALSQFIVLESIVAMTLMAFGALMLANEHSTMELRRLAEQDPLTSVFNRRSFLALLDKALSQAHRKNRPLSVLLVDLDHFKSINDTWGHKGGDDALRHFVGVTASGLRNGDLIGRLGGEEFAILLADSELPDAAAIAGRLRALVADSPLPMPQGTIQLTVSIGVALAGECETPEAFLHRADKAMYLAKERGRNRIEIMASEADLHLQTCPTG